MKRGYCRNIQKQPTLDALCLRQASYAGCRIMLCIPYGGDAASLVAGANELKKRARLPSCCQIGRGKETRKRDSAMDHGYTARE